MKKIGEIIVSSYLGFARVIIDITKDLVEKENINKYRNTFISNRLIDWSCIRMRKSYRIEKRKIHHCHRINKYFIREQIIEINLVK